MARPETPGMIDGFMSVQAVRHQGERGPDRKPSGEDPSAANAAKDAPDSAQTQKKASIGHTALPSRHELICYACGYGFVVTGRLDKVICPRCREQLETGDHHIEGEWQRDLRTVGQVYVHSGASVGEITIMATDIIIAGDCTQAVLKPTRLIELETGGVTDPEALNARRIRIRAGARISLSAPLRCSDLEVYGELQATATPTGIVTIHPGGMFRGHLAAEHLIVHEGGGLNATLRIAPHRAPAAPKPSSTSPGMTGHETPKATAPVKRAAAPASPPPPPINPASKRVSSSKGKKRASKRPGGRVE